MSVFIRNITILLLFSSFTNSLYAGHEAGAMITYLPTGVPDQYEVTLEIYTTCSVLSPGTTATIDFWSDCGNPTVSLILNLESTESISQYCSDPQYQSECDGGTYVGYLRKSFKGLVTLPSTCNQWHFSYSNPSSRISDNINLGGVYVESTVNTTNNIENTSPIIITPHIPFVCLNVPVTWNFGIIEPDCDSLVYSLVSPQTASGVNIGFLPGYSATSPIPGISINPANGNLSFTPSSLGSFTLAIKIEEYNQNGTLVGTVVQDFQIYVLNCTNNAPAFDANITNFDNNNTGASYDPSMNMVSMCDGDEFCFDLTLTDFDLSDTLGISSNLTSALPNATISFSGVNPVTANVCWVYDPDYTENVVWFQGRDNACEINGLDFFSIKLHLPVVLDISYRDSICGDLDAELEVSGTDAVTWSVISGDPIVIGSNFSCNNCVDPIATPAITTTYLVETGSVCLESDSVTIVVVDGNLGNLNTEILLPDTAVCTGTCIQIDAVSEVEVEDVFTSQFSSSTNVFIGTNSTVNSQIFVSNVSTGFDTITVGSIKEVCFNIEHDNVEDLDVYLKAPNGALFELSTGNGGAGNDYANTCFTIDAGTPVINGSAPFSNDFVPEENTLDSAFSDGGVGVFGPWSIQVTNNSSTLFGLIDDWNITFCKPLVYSIGSDSIVWSNLDGMPTGQPIADPLLCPTLGGEYILTGYDIHNCWSSDTINISVLPSSGAGNDTIVELSVHAGQVDLFDYLGGNPAIGGVWEDSLSGFSISGIVNPDTLVDMSTYLYITVNANGCPDSAYLTLDIIDYCVAPATPNPNILPLPNAGNDTTVNLNESLVTVDLFDYLGGNPDPGGYWGFPLGNNFNPVVTVNLLPATSTYYYIVENGNGCVDTAFLQANVVDDLGLDKSLSQFKFNAYPNPVNGILTVQYEKPVNVGGVSFTLYSPSGEKIQVLKISKNEIDVSNLANGMYYLKVEHSGGGSAVKMIIKN